MTNTYRTILKPIEAEFKDRGSRFLAFGFPVGSPDDIKRCLQNIKKIHPKAIHHCYAWRLGTDGSQYRANDDGEPSGSAGRPILGQIDSLEITDTIIIVVRYFGGTLLGVPGLINAYKTVSQEALKGAEVIEKNIEIKMILSFEYNLMNSVMQIVKQHDVSILKNEMQLFCRLEIGVPTINHDICMQKFKDLYGLELE